MFRLQGQYLAEKALDPGLFDSVKAPCTFSSPQTHL